MKCKGCGVTFQNTSKEIPGYISKKGYSEEDYCMRCFKLIHYNESPKAMYTNEDFLKILKEIEKEDCLIIYLVDLFDFFGSNIQAVKKTIKRKDYLIVANKIDLIPKSVKENKLHDWLKCEIKEAGYKPLDFLLISALRKKNIDQLLTLIDNHRRGRNVYVVGATNTGKSTLLNGIVSAVRGKETKVITTSYFAGTTLSTIQIPIDDNQFLIDTPGIINEGQITNYLSKESLNKVVAKSEIRARTYQLYSEQVLFITGLVQFRFLSGERTSFTAYFSNDIDIHRTKLERADELVDNHLTKDLLNPPSEIELERIRQFVTKKFLITKGNQDIVIDGFGWVTINYIYSDLEIEVIVPQKTNVHLRYALI